MNTMKKRTINNNPTLKKHYTRIQRKIRTIAFGTICGLAVLIFILVLISSTTASAAINKDNNSKNSPYKYYTNYTIEKGDSLWSIASEHVSGTSNIIAYIDEIKKLNGLYDDSLTQGQSLCVIYYSNDYLE